MIQIACTVVQTCSEGEDRKRAKIERDCLTLHQNAGFWSEEME